MDDLFHDTDEDQNIPGDETSPQAESNLAAPSFRAPTTRRPVLAGDAEGDPLAGLELFRNVPYKDRWRHPAAQQAKEKKTGIAVGDTVVYRFYEEDEEERVTIEITRSDPARGILGADTPLAKALLGRKAGEIITVNLPGGEQFIEIVAWESRG